MELLLRLGLLEHSPHSPRVPYGGLRRKETSLLFLHVAVRRHPGHPTKYRKTNQSAFTQFTHDPVCDYRYIPGISHLSVKVAGGLDVRLVTLDDLMWRWETGLESLGV